MNLRRKVPAHRIRPKAPITRQEFESALAVIVDDLTDELELALGLVGYVAERGVGQRSLPTPLPVPSTGASSDGPSSSCDHSP